MKYQLNFKLHGLHEKTRDELIDFMLIRRKNIFINQNNFIFSETPLNTIYKSLFIELNYQLTETSWSHQGTLSQIENKLYEI